MEGLRFRNRSQSPAFRKRNSGASEKERVFHQNDEFDEKMTKQYGQLGAFRWCFILVTVIITLSICLAILCPLLVKDNYFFHPVQYNWARKLQFEHIAAFTLGNEKANAFKETDDDSKTLFSGLDFKVFVYPLPEELRKGILQLNLVQPSSLSDMERDCVTTFYSAEFWIPEWFDVAENPLRTLDPQEADFFLVPIYPVCFRHNTLQIIPGTRVLNPFPTSDYLWKVLNHIRTEYPYFNQLQGKKHIWTFTQGYGAKLFDTTVVDELQRRDEISPITSSFIKQLKEKHSVSMIEQMNTSWQTFDQKQISSGWTLIKNGIFLLSNGDRTEEQFDEEKDIVIPPLISHLKCIQPIHHIRSRPDIICERKPRFGQPGESLELQNEKRQLLLLFAGSIHWTSSDYSKGTRQALAKLYQGTAGMKIVPSHYPEYCEDLFKAEFCFCPEGKCTKGRLLISYQDI
eukprot:g3134.t1